jgi:hypothetical protein
VKRSIYEDPNRLTPRREEDEDGDGVEWVKLAEQDMVTGRWTWHQRWRPFNETPFSQWEPRR